MDMSIGGGFSTSAISYKNAKDSTAEALFGKTTKKKKDSHDSAGIAFPGQLSREEQQKIDNLKNEAMQIASNSQGGLTPAEEGRIKRIENEIGKITGMPMHENLTNKTRKIAENNKLEQQGKADEKKDEQKSMQMRSDPASQSDAAAGSGMNVLQQKAFYTNIKLMNSGSSSFSGTGKG
ncbi:hypothetical protein [Maridesulfovibrio bastinii]|uniref:hypothetical protein n=1 Tax=Maridesulfovibrio bastinii TaxID=47157 RepID=UPI00040A8EA2|nr:hypothetical protein [Maridesulfovibrio bastinii]